MQRGATDQPGESFQVLILGLEELVNVRNIERLKKDLRACYKLIDSFLAPLERSGDLTQCVECVPVPHGAVLQECLEAFAGAAGSRFGCLGVESYGEQGYWVWGGSPHPGGSAWSPAGSGRVLGKGQPPTPSALFSPGAVGGLQPGSPRRAWTVEAPAPPVPLFSQVPVDPSGAEKQPELSAAPRIRGGGCRARALRHFYTLVATRYFPWEGSPAPPQEPFQAGFPHRARHCYVVSATHKAYAIHAPQHQLFLLLAPHVPTFALRPLAARTLQRLTGDTAL
ncbi:Protein fuzzy like protein [Chelonia mydas]|uniref:Protein fuzzy like protein n=1 Tax=Chelonia mydas TaxID=8469 RepID=M7CM16_CHEMY|nr:Protein fuzzy like protein [Chelonia mydas]